MCRREVFLLLLINLGRGILLLLVFIFFRGGGHNNKIIQKVGVKVIMESVILSFTQ